MLNSEITTSLFLTARARMSTYIWDISSACHLVIDQLVYRWRTCSCLLSGSIKMKLENAMWQFSLTPMPKIFRHSILVNCTSRNTTHTLISMVCRTKDKPSSESALDSAIKTSTCWSFNTMSMPKAIATKQAMLASGLMCQIPWQLKMNSKIKLMTKTTVLCRSISGITRAYLSSSASSSPWFPSRSLDFAFTIRTRTRTTKRLF